jgi:hypothetical protein
VSDSLRTMGDSPRRGLPFLRPYEYKGTGRDELTPRGVMAAWNARLREAGATTGTWRRLDREQLTAIEIGLARSAQAAHVVTPSPPVRRPAPPAQGRARAAAPENAPEPARAPVPKPAKDATEPGRCGKCQYLLTAPGHTVTCGDGAA